ncbi:hypothetical protein [Serinibacter salmoneus]|nr:hypothetical protein [Serinibacter salmoneus]
MVIVAGVLSFASALGMLAGELVSWRRSGWRRGVAPRPAAVWVTALAVSLLGVLALPGDREPLLVVLLGVLIPGGFGAVVARCRDSLRMAVASRGGTSLLTIGGAMPKCLRCVWLTRMSPDQEATMYRTDFTLSGARARVVAFGVAMALLVSFVVAAPGTAASAESTATQQHEIVDAERGGVVARESGVDIYEMVDESGEIVGYAIAESAQDRLPLSLAQTRLGAGGPEHSVSANFWTCSAAIAWFIGQTVFPSVKIARLVVRLGQFVSKYGFSKTVKIFTGAYKLSGRTAKEEFIDLAKALSGVGGLQVGCGF